jgi:hypothetical protein
VKVRFEHLIYLVNAAPNNINHSRFTEIVFISSIKPLRLMSDIDMETLCPVARRLLPYVCVGSVLTKDIALPL